MVKTFQNLSELPLLEQAAGWFDRALSGTLSAQQLAEFEEWKDASPAHQLAYAEIEAAFTEVKAAADLNQMLALRHEALSRIVMPKASGKRGFIIAGAIAASIVAVVGTWNVRDVTSVSRNPAFLAQRAPPTSGAPTSSMFYRTAVGERLSVALPDGSRAILNTASQLRVEYSSTERRLILERGQALFRVAKGQTRPFVVQALDRIVTAHGTVFDVRIAPDKKIKVSLLEGSVSVADVAAPSQSATQLQPKEVLVASRDEIQVSRNADVEKDESWRDGLIIFEDQNLAEAVAEVNRYVRRPIVLQDDRLGQIRVSGAFRTGETAAFVEALQLSFPVRVARQDPEKIVLTYRG